MKRNSSSKVIRIFNSAMLLLAVALPNMANAQVRLTDVVTFGADAAGTLLYQPDVWETRPNGNYNNWLQSLPSGIFLNGPSDSEAQPDVTLQPGTNSFRIYTSPGIDNPKFGINLFFNGSLTPSISAFGPMLTNVAQVHSFSPNSGSPTPQAVPVYNSGIPGAGTLSFVSGNQLITLTDFYLATPAVFNEDQGGQTTLGPDGILDYVGGFTLVVTTNNTATICTPPASGLVSWWPGESSAVDIIGTNNGIMTNGATFAAGKVGQAFSFNGSGQFVKVPQSSTVNSFGNQITIEFWMKANLSNTMTSFQGLVATDHYGIEISNGLGGLIGLNFFVDTLNGSALISSANGGGIPVSSGIWHHVAGTYDGTKLQLYIDGQPAGAAVSASGVIVPMISTSYLSIGSDDGRTYCGCGGRYFWGLIDDPTIYNHALSSNEIAAIYNAGSAGKCAPASANCVTPPSGLISWWPGESSAIDIIGTNNGTLSASGASYSTGLVGQAFRFDGTNGYVRIPDAPALKPTNVTVEAWVWLDPALPPNRGGEQIIFKKNTWSAWFEGYSLLKITVDNGNGTYSDRFQFCISRTGNQVAINSTTIAQRGVWYHVAATYDGNQSKLYVNGVAEATATAGFALDYGADPVYIGTSGTWAPYLSMFGGIIDEPSLYNRALSSNEIAAIYNAGSAGKCQSAEPLPLVIAGPITNQANGHIYYLLVSSTWTKAEAKAVTLGGHLATINDAAEDTWVFSTFGSYGGINRNLWIGLRDTANDTTTVAANHATNFLWVSGSDAPYRNWYPGEPNNGDWTGIKEYFGFIDYFYGGKWQDSVDSAQLPGKSEGQYGVVEILTTNNISPQVIAGPITNQANGHIYYLLANSTWTEAEAKAVTLGGHLATINDAAENNWVLSTFANYGGAAHSLWIGFNDVQQEGTFGWSSGEPVSYTRWLSGEPNNANGGENYVIIEGYDPSYPSQYGYWVDTKNITTAGGTLPPFYGVVEIPTTGGNPTCTPPPSGLVGWWPGEGSASNIVGTNNGTLQGNLAYINGQVGLAFNFKATNADVKIPASPTLNVGSGGGFTLESWINVSNATARTPIFEWNNGAGNWGVHFWISPSFKGELYANVVDSGGGWHSLSSAAGLVQSGIYKHVALTYDKVSGVAKIYLNGNVVAQQFIGSFTPLTSYDLYLGRRASGAPGDVGTLIGILDEPSVYNRALSSNEIAAIYNAGTAGKCSLPPTLFGVTPTNWYVNEGSTVSYVATAAGSPTLAYQWQHNGSVIPGEANATLTLSNVVYAQAGNYTVVVSNLAGLASSNVTLRVNRAPIADASASASLLISPNDTNAIAVLDGSRSSDPDGDALNYAWFISGEAAPFATGVVTMKSLPVGTNYLILTVNDGMASGSQNFAVEVITASQAVDRLSQLVKTNSDNSMALIASLRAALLAIDRSHPAVAIQMLEVFINKVHVQLEPVDPALAAEFIAEAQAIIDALNGDGNVALKAIELLPITSGANGKSHLKIKGNANRTYVIETSTNMVDWVPAGVATRAEDGTYEFDDTQAQGAGVRFYRVVSPQ